MRKIYIRTIQDGIKKLWSFLISIELELFSYYLVIPHSPNITNEKRKFA